MDASATQSRPSTDVQSCSNQQSEEDLVEGLILDYACKNYMQPVISEILISKGPIRQHELRIPHLRFLAATIYTIVHTESIDQYDEVLKHLQLIQDAKQDLVSERKFVKLTAGLKAKVILNRLKTRFDYASVCAKLNQYFPKSELKSAGASQVQAKLIKYQLGLRRRLTRLIISPTEREAFAQDEENQELGSPLTESLKDWVKAYTDRLNENLKVPVIEQISSEGPASQISRDIEDSPTSCMDHLLSICFNGLPTEDQLLYLLTLIKRERAKASDLAESLRLSSDSGSHQGKTDKKHQNTSKNNSTSTAAHGDKKRTQLGRPTSTSGKGLSIETSLMISKSASTKIASDKSKNHERLSSTAPSSATYSSGDPAKTSNYDTTRGQRLEFVNTSPKISKSTSIRTASDKRKDHDRLSSTAPSRPAYAIGDAAKMVFDDPTRGQRLGVMKTSSKISKSTSTKIASDKSKNHERLSSTAPSAAYSSGDPAKTSNDDPTRGHRSKVIRKVVNDEPAHVTDIKQSLPPKSKIYFSRTKSKVTCSQPAKSAPINTTHPDDKRVRYQVPKQTSDVSDTPGLSSRDDLKDGKSAAGDAQVSQPNSGSSGSSSQSTTSLSIISPRRGRKAQLEPRDKRVDILLEELETSTPQEVVDYTGSVTVIDETPSSGEINQVGFEDEQEYQCNTVSSSSSSGSSGPSQPSQDKEEESKATREKQKGSNESSLLDSSIVYPTPDAVEILDQFTYIRTPLAPVQDDAYSSSSESQEEISSSDSEDGSSVVSDSSDSELSLDYSPLKMPSKGSRYPHRRIPSLRSFLESPVTQASLSPVIGGGSIMVIKPCVVVLHRLREVIDATNSPQLRRSRRLRPKEIDSESDIFAD